MIRIQLADGAKFITLRDVEKLQRSRNLWRAAAVLFALAFVAVCLMGCESEGSGDHGTDATISSGRWHTPIEPTIDGRVDLGDGGVTAPPDATPPDATTVPFVWARTFAITWTKTSQTCIGTGAISYDRMVYDGTRARFYISTGSSDATTPATVVSGQLHTSGFGIGNQGFQPMTLSPLDGDRFSGEAVRVDSPSGCNHVYLLEGVAL